MKVNLDKLDLSKDVASHEASDYAYLYSNGHRFYYGYEVCNKKGEYIFIVEKVKRKLIEKTPRYTRFRVFEKSTSSLIKESAKTCTDPLTKEDSPVSFLLFGVGLFLNENSTKKK